MRIDTGQGGVDTRKEVRKKTGVLLLGGSWAPLISLILRAQLLGFTQRKSSGKGVKGVQGCALTCKDAHWRAVITGCPAVVKNNELGKYLLLRKEVHEMMYSETVVKQHLRQGPMFVSRSIPFTVCDIDIPSLYDRYIERMGRKNSGRIRTHQVPCLGVRIIDALNSLYFVLLGVL